MKKYCYWLIMLGFILVGSVAAADTYYVPNIQGGGGTYYTPGGGSTTYTPNIQGGGGAYRHSGGGTTTYTPNIQGGGGVYRNYP